MTAGYMLLALFIILIAWIPIWQVAAAGFILIGSVTSFSLTGRTIFSQEIVKPRWRTIVNAVVIICSAVSLGAAGVVGGKIIPQFGFNGMFAIGAALALISVLVSFAWQWMSSRLVAVPKEI
jgi:predicted MFS family arabinose efflux permease